MSLAELLAPGADEWWAGPIEFERLADDHAAPLSYPTNGLFLFTVETEPVAAEGKPANDIKHALGISRASVFRILAEQSP